MWLVVLYFLQSVIVQYVGQNVTVKLYRHYYGCWSIQI